MDAPYPPARQASSSKPKAALRRTSNLGTVLRILAAHLTTLAALRAVLKGLATTSPAPPDETAPSLHAHATKLGLDCSHRGVCDGLIALYPAGAARALFSSDLAPDVVSWTSMVTGHARLGLFRQAAALFLAMVDEGAVVVDAVAAAAVFPSQNPVDSVDSSTWKMKTSRSHHPSFPISRLRRCPIIQAPERPKSGTARQGPLSASSTAAALDWTLPTAGCGGVGP